MDSGCSFHMCPNQDWFENLEIKEGGQVLLGNNKTCRVKESGTIGFKLHNGTENTLHQVRYIPELKRNLISLEFQEMNGYSFKTENSVLKVMKRSLTIMKGIRKNGLYSLQRSTVVGTTAAVIKPETSISNLRNMRLGHVSERGLTELSKQILLCGNHSVNWSFVSIASLVKLRG